MWTWNMLLLESRYRVYQDICFLNVPKTILVTYFLHICLRNHVEIFKGINICIM